MPTESETVVTPAVVETVAPTEAPVVAEQPWAKARQEQTARGVIRKLGGKASKDIPLEQAVASVQERVDSQKARRQAAEKRADAAEQNVESMKTSIAALTAMQGLSESQREVVKGLAGDDPKKQLKHIETLKAITALTPPAAVAPAGTETPAKAIPATTAPAAAPSPAAISAELPLAEQYEQIRSISDPTKQGTARAVFLLTHGDQLLRDKFPHL